MEIKVCKQGGRKRGCREEERIKIYYAQVKIP